MSSFLSVLRTRKLATPIRQPLPSRTNMTDLRRRGGIARLQGAYSRNRPLSTGWARLEKGSDPFDLRGSDPFSNRAQPTRLMAYSGSKAGPSFSIASGTGQALQ